MNSYVIIVQRTANHVLVEILVLLAKVDINECHQHWFAMSVMEQRLFFLLINAVIVAFSFFPLVIIMELLRFLNS